MKRRKTYSLRFTVTQSHFMRCNAANLKLPKWEERFQWRFDTTINLRQLDGEELEQLRDILKAAGGVGKTYFGKSRAGVTRRAIRRKLRVLEEFAGLSAIDRLGDLRR